MRHVRLPEAARTKDRGADGSKASRSSLCWQATIGFAGRGALASEERPRAERREKKGPKQQDSSRTDQDEIQIFERTENPPADPQENDAHWRHPRLDEPREPVFARANPPRFGESAGRALSGLNAPPFTHHVVPRGDASEASTEAGEEVVVIRRRRKAGRSRPRSSASRGRRRRSGALLLVERVTR